MSASLRDERRPVLWLRRTIQHSALTAPSLVRSIDNQMAQTDVAPLMRFYRRGLVRVTEILGFSFILRSSL
jgi:hypothetical protein